MDRAFAGEHRWDRNAFLGLVILAWVGLLMGFVPQIQHHVAKQGFSYPPILHLHALLFVGWMMLLGTLHITDAGFARWLGDPLFHWLGPSLPATIVVMYGPPDLLMLALGAYDLITRKRLHPAYITGFIRVFTIQISAAWLYGYPAWKPVAAHLLGH